jgi:hypothetical protein
MVKSEKGMFHDLLAFLKEHVYFSTTSIATSNVSFVGENPLRCTTQDEKGLVLFVVFFYSIF